jgi:hypothetical protein
MPHAYIINWPVRGFILCTRYWPRGLGIMRWGEILIGSMGKGEGAGWMWPKFELGIGGGSEHAKLHAQGCFFFLANSVIDG